MTEIHRLTFHGRPWLYYGFSGRQPEVSRQSELGRLLVHELQWRGPSADLHQVHGNFISPLSCGMQVEAMRPKADGWILDCCGVLALLRVADCIPALLYDSHTSQAALLHAGRRGIAAGILPQTIAALLANGAQKSDLHLLLGPGIGACCYQVPEELARSFARQSGYPNCHSRSDGTHAWLDLKGTLRYQAQQHGLNDAHIRVNSPCTLCQQQHFYSHRGGDTQLRQYAFAWRAL